MPFTNGVFKRVRSWVADKAAGLKIQPDLMDQDANDIALALSNCVLRDGTGAPTADVSFAGHAAKYLKAAVDAGDALSLGATIVQPLYVSGANPLGQFVATQGGYGAGLRNDGATAYLLSTASGQATGGPNGFRPFYWNLTTGAVTIAGDGAVTTIGGDLSANGRVNFPNARPTWAGLTPYDTGNLSAGQLNNIAGVGQLFGTGNLNPVRSNNNAISYTWDGGSVRLVVDGGDQGRVYTDKTLTAGQLDGIRGVGTLFGSLNLTRGQISAQLGFTPAVNYWDGNHNIGFSFDGSNLINVVDGNGGFGVSWDAHNFNPGAKMNNDGGATVVGYNSGNSSRPYISGSAYRDLMYSNDGTYRSIGSEVLAGYTVPTILGPDLPQGQVTHLCRTNGAHEHTVFWTGQTLVITVDGSPISIQQSNSDARLKEGVADLTGPDAADLLGKLRPVTYEWTAAAKERFLGGPGLRHGFIAQDLERLFPGMVVDSPAEAEDGTPYKALSSDSALQICAVLVKANQLMSDRIAALEAKIHG